MKCGKAAVLEYATVLKALLPKGVSGLGGVLKLNPYSYDTTVPTYHSRKTENLRAFYFFTYNRTISPNNKYCKCNLVD